MTNELNDLVPAQEKLEWVTPKISLMGADGTAGGAKSTTVPNEFFNANSDGGPS